MKQLSLLLLLLLWSATRIDLSAEPVDTTITLTGHSGPLLIAHFSRDGSRLVTIGMDSTARVWSTYSGIEIMRVRHSGERMIDAFLSPDGKRLITFGGSRVMRWNTVSESIVDTIGRFSLNDIYQAENGTIVGVTDKSLLTFSFVSSQSVQERELYDPDAVTTTHRFLQVSLSDNGEVGTTLRAVTWRSPDLPPNVGPYYGIEIRGFVPPLTFSAQTDTLELDHDATSLVFRPRSLSEVAAIIDGKAYAPLSVGPFRLPAGRHYEHERVYRITYDADGDRIYTISLDTLKTWNLASGELLAIDTDGVRDVATVSTARGVRRAFCYGDGQVRLIGPVEGEEPEPLRTGPVRSLDLGEVVVGESREETIVYLLRNIGATAKSVTIDLMSNQDFVYELSEGGGSVSIGPGERHSVTLRFTPQRRGRVTASLTINSSQFIPAVEITGTGLLKYFQPNEDRLDLGPLPNRLPRILFSDDRHMIGSGLTDMKVWDSDYGNVLLGTPSGHLGLLDSGETLVTVIGDTLFRIGTSSWEVESRHDFAKASLPSASSIHLGPGRRVGGEVKPTILTTNGTTVLIRRALIGEGVDTVRTVTGPRTRIADLAFRPGGERYLLGSGTFEWIYMWEAATGDTLWTAKRPHDGGYSSALFSPDGSIVAVRHREESIVLRASSDGTIIRELTGHTAAATPSTFSPDGTRLLTLGADSTARIWDVSTGTEIVRLFPHPQNPTAGIFSPDGLRVVTRGDTDSTIFVWDAMTGALLRSVASIPSKAGDSPALLPLHARRENLAFNLAGTRLGVSGTGGIAIFGPSVAIPYIVPDRDDIDLTPLAIAGDTAIEVSVRNRGPIALELRPKIFPYSPAFALESADDPFILSPGEERSILIVVQTNQVEEKGNSSSAAGVATAYLGLMYKDEGAIATVRLQARSSLVSDIADRDRLASSRGLIRSIAPNPTGGDLRLEIDPGLVAEGKIVLYNGRGEEVRTLFKGRVESSRMIEIDLDGESAGEYFLVVQVGESVDVRPIVIY